MPTGDERILPKGTAFQRDLGDIAGIWQEVPEFDQAIAEQDQVDERLWR